MERKEKFNIQISFDPFLLFVLTSLLVHGLGILILLNRFPLKARQEKESTPIDFIVVPPETATEEPLPDTERKAVNNSVAKGEVKPDLPSATNKIGNEQPTITSQSSPTIQANIPNPSSASVVPPTPKPPQVEPTPPLESKPATPPPLRAKLPKPAKTESASPSPATPPLVKKPKPVIPNPLRAKVPKSIEPSLEEVKPNPIEQTPLLSESDSTSIPLPEKKPAIETTPPPELPSVATKLPSQPKPLESLPEKKPAIETTPPPELPSVATKLPPLSKPLEPLPEKKPAIETTPPPELPSVATKLPPQPKPFEPLPENTSVPPDSSITPSPQQQTPVGSGSASLLGGTYRKSVSEDSGSSFLNPQANASQQALNSSGIDARQDLNMGPYFAEIRRRVRRNWQPSSPGDNRHTVLAFSIQRNGQITGLRVRQSSGSEKIDRESLAAVQKAAPFGTLPANFPSELLDVEFSFNIYVNQGVFTPQLENWQRF